MDSGLAATRRPGMTERMETSVPDTHQRVEAAIKAFAKGELVVVMDDDDRENEGDLFVAASLCTPEKMAFIIATRRASSAPRSAVNWRASFISIRWWRKTMR